MRVFLIIAAFLLVFAAACFAFEYSSEDPISEEALEEQDPFLVSLCVITDGSFSEDNYLRLRVVLGKAAREFTPFALSFYIAGHDQEEFGRKVPLQGAWRYVFEDKHGVTCDIMVLVSNRDYAFDGHNIAGVAGIGVNSILIDEFSTRGLVYQKRTIQHELGHIFGAVHVDTPGSVMRPNIGDAGDGWDERNFDLITENRDRFQ